VAGRFFGVDDPPTVAVINEKAAANLFGLDSVGIVIQDPMNVPTEIIGIMKRRSTDSSNRQDPTIFYNDTNVAEPSSTPDRVLHAHFRAPAILPPASVELNVNVVSAAYFRTMGLSLVAGSEFNRVWAPGEARVGVLNQEAADLYFDGKPLGTGMIDDFGIRTNIIGVVSSRAFGTFQQRAEPTIYFPMGQDTPSRMTLILGASAKNHQLLTGVRRRIDSVPGPHLAPVIRRLSTQLAQSGLATLRIATMIVGVSASVSLLLSFFGLLRIQSDAERQHRRDLALHVALGAQRWRIVLTVFARAVRFAVAGTLIGTAASLVLLRLVARDTVVSVPPVWVWLLAPILATVAVMAAAVLPACRASTTSPLIIMRDDR
jgi:ABC-type antimicrobial peptide transport system permease subunit